MANKDEPTYLPIQKVRIGRAGYKGKNIKTYDPVTGEGKPNPATDAVVTAPDEASAPKTATPRRTAPKAGIKPLKSTSGSK